MATKIRIQHEWNIPREVVYEHLFDNELIEKVEIALKTANRRLVEKKEDKGRITQRYEVKANPDEIPAAARKVMPLEAFHWTEESVWDPDAKRFSWKIITNVMRDKIDCSGTCYYEKVGASGTRRVVEGAIEIKIPFVGRIAERVILGKVESSFEDTGRAEGDYFTEKAVKD